jgi:phosphohistidine phosphatase SixA
MRRSMLLCALLAVFLVVVIVVARPAPSASRPPERSDSASLIVLVRHAEKAAAPSDDPPLTAAGVKRAQSLAAALRDAGVTAIITTQLRRTRETAQPLASALSLTPEVVTVGGGEAGAHAEAVAAAVRRHVGGVVLVVGHSDTIPAIIAALGGPRLPDICESVFSHLFALVPGAGEARLVRSRYGAADRHPEPGCQ